jgi:glycosyltransferase involved in cell wall biosynthesis
MVVESIISNTKVFAYEVGNLSELINNENGLLIPDYDPHKMADAIIQFYRKWNSNSTDLKISSSVKKYYDDENFKIHFTKIING